ncbi:retinol dehydrogenase 11-like [Tropilaelaps mercedesae]|uniref:Retinol dehydrogenase 11-like n=1 Tax=Tropilaelaps mercedesae TaxID=418985 RepID=A0A1V9XX50_9ACAR|nr:retinol dehydrogenase 11-like [Tropilaelaps mercedesae]
MLDTAAQATVNRMPLPSPEALSATREHATREATSPLLAFGGGLLLIVLVVAVLLKIYAVVTEGRYVCKRDLTGKVVIVTGSNTGLGKTTARALAACGAKVILACRNLKKAETARDEIIAATNNQDVICMELDLASFRSVRQFAKRIYSTQQRLDILINNAGLLTPPQHETTEDGHEVSIQSNHLGHFLLTNLLLDLLKKSEPSRIVVVGSCGQWFGNMNPEQPLDFERYQFPLFNYCSTKVLNMLFTVELAKRLKGSGVTVNCGHPGFVHSDFATTDSSIQAWLFTKILKLYGKSPEVGAMTSVYLATSDDIKVSGRYFADCRPAMAPIWATRDSKAAKLWEVSENMTELNSHRITPEVLSC